MMRIATAKANLRLMINEIRDNKTEIKQIRRAKTKSLEFAISALEKQIPKKPRGNELCTCPECGTYNDTIKKRRNTVSKDIVYCWHCGQAIDWGGSNEEEN